MPLSSGVAEQDRGVPRPVQGEPVRLIAVRALISVAVAAVLGLLLWRLVPRSLSVRTDIVGYPIFANYNYNRYYAAFYITAIAFPILDVATYDALSPCGALYAAFTAPGPALPVVDRPVLLTSRRARV